MTLSSVIKWLALGCAIAALLTMFVLLNHHQSAPMSTAQVRGSTMMEQPVIIENRGDKVRWKLHAAKAEQGVRDMQLTQPHLIIFNENGAAIPITGDRARFDPIKRSAHFIGHVTIDYQQWHLQSAEALFEGASGKLHISGAFSARSDDHITMVGNDLTVDQPHQRLEVRQHIKIEDLR